MLGVALVDAVSRNQAAPVSARGWFVVGKPVVIGPDGKPQTKFTDGRNPALPPGTSYVNIDGIDSDAAAGKLAKTKTTWKLRAPAQAGKVPLVAVMLLRHRERLAARRGRDALRQAAAGRLHGELGPDQVQRRGDGRRAVSPVRCR